MKENFFSCDLCGKTEPKCNTTHIKISNYFGDTKINLCLDCIDKVYDYMSIIKEFADERKKEEWG